MTKDRKQRLESGSNSRERTRITAEDSAFDTWLPPTTNVIHVILCHQLKAMTFLMRDRITAVPK